MCSFRKRASSALPCTSLYQGGREQFVQIGVKSCVIQVGPPPTEGSRHDDPGVRRGCRGGSTSATARQMAAAWLVI
jgi:hypothetical protein